MWCRSCPSLNLLCKRLSTVECEKTEHDYHFSAYADTGSRWTLWKLSTSPTHFTNSMSSRIFGTHAYNRHALVYGLSSKKNTFNFHSIPFWRNLFYLAKKTLTSDAHPSNCQLKKKVSLHTEFDPQNDRSVICIIQDHILSSNLPLHL